MRGTKRRVRADLRPSPAIKHRFPHAALLPGQRALLKLGIPLGDRRLAVRSLVLVDNALARGLVQLPAGGTQRSPGRLHVSSVRGLTELADGRTEQRLDGLVPLVRLIV